MTKDEMQSILENHLAWFRTWSYERLAERVEHDRREHDCLEHCEGTAPDGTTYQMEFDAFWNDKPHGDIRVWGDFSANPQRRLLSAFGVFAMTASDVQSLVLAEIGDDWNRTDARGVDLRSCLVEPRRMQIIWRTVNDGQRTQETREVWLVLEERPQTDDGCRIVFDDCRRTFGLAAPGFPSDPHPCLVGYYGDFWTTFAGM